MPEMVASYSSQRFLALLDFQRDVDLTYPSHMGKKHTGSEGFTSMERKAAGHGQARQGDSWHQNWSDSLSLFLSSSLKSKVSSPPSPCAVQAMAPSPGTLTRSQGQFSPQKFIRNALKRAFASNDLAMDVKRTRLDDCSTAEPMVCG